MNSNTVPTVLEAFKAGYRRISPFLVWLSSSLHVSVIDCAQLYRNEAECGEAIRRSGLPRSEIFYSMLSRRLIWLFSTVLRTLDSYQDLRPRSRLHIHHCSSRPLSARRKRRLHRPLPHPHSQTRENPTTRDVPCTSREAKRRPHQIRGRLKLWRPSSGGNSRGGIRGARCQPNRSPPVVSAARDQGVL